MFKGVGLVFGHVMGLLAGQGSQEMQFRGSANITKDADMTKAH